MLDLARKITTRDGRAVRVLCSDRKGVNSFPLLALISEVEGGESLRSYSLDGSYSTAIHADPLDLINPPIEVERYMLLRSTGTLGDVVSIFPDFNLDSASLSRVVKVRITVID